MIDIIRAGASFIDEKHFTSNSVIGIGLSGNNTLASYSSAMTDAWETRLEETTEYRER